MNLILINVKDFRKGSLNGSAAGRASVWSWWNGARRVGSSVIRRRWDFVFLGNDAGWMALFIAVRTAGTARFSLCCVCSEWRLVAGHSERRGLCCWRSC